MLVFPLIFACAPSVPPGSTLSSTASSPSATGDTAASLSCAEVVGNPMVWLISRADPTQVSRPSELPVGENLAWSLSGPDARGWLYLLDGHDVLYRSEDRGCTWDEVGPMPVERDARVITAPDSSRIYLQDNAKLAVSEDAGETFALLSADVPVLLQLYPGAPDVFRGSGLTEFRQSVDGGSTWLPWLDFPGDAWAGTFDPSDPERVVASGSVLWAYDSGGWVEAESAHEWYSAAVWDGGGDIILFGSIPGGGSDLLASVGGVLGTYEPRDWQPTPDDSSMTLAWDGDVIALGGYLYHGGTDGESVALVVVREADGTVVRHLAEGFETVRQILVLDDVIVVLLQTPGDWFHD